MLRPTHFQHNNNDINSQTNVVKSDIYLACIIVRILWRIKIDNVISSH